MPPGKNNNAAAVLNDPGEKSLLEPSLLSLTLYFRVGDVLVSGIVHNDEIISASDNRTTDASHHHSGIWTCLVLALNEDVVLRPTRFGIRRNLREYFVIFSALLNNTGDGSTELLCLSRRTRDEGSSVLRVSSYIPSREYDADIRGL